MANSNPEVFMPTRVALCRALVLGSILFAAVGCDTTTRTTVEPSPAVPEREKKVNVDINIKGRNVDVDVKSKP